MAKNNQLIFNVDGDVTGLRKALADGTNSIHKFGTESGDLLGGLSGKVSDLTGRFGGLSTGLLGTAGAMGIVAGGIYSLVASSAEYVNQYNEVARTSSLTVEQLQKLEKQFKGLGFTVEKFGDLNRDVLDHLGDAFRDGSGPAEDMKAYGINIKDFNKYLNQSDGGIRSVAEAFYQMRKAGKSTAEITNMLETLGSDGSKLTGVFSQFNDTTELMNSISSQTATLTNDNAAKFADFESKVNSLSTSFHLWMANALGPTIDDLNTLFSLMNKDWSSTDFMQTFRNFYYGGDNGIAKMLRDIDGVDPKGIPGTKEWNAAHKDNNFPPKPEASTTTPQVGWVNKEKEAAAAKAAADKAARELETQKRKEATALNNWNAAITKSGINDGDIRVKEFNRQQDEIIKKIKESGSVLKKSQDDIDHYVNEANATRLQKFKDMIDEMIGYSDPNKELRGLSDNLAGLEGQLSTEQMNGLLQKQNERVGLTNMGSDANNPFDNTNVLDQKRKDLEAQRDLELTINEQLNRQLGTSQEEYLKRKKAIQEKYSKQILAVETDNTQAQIGLLSESAGSLGTILRGALGEGSKAAQAAFALQKGISIAQIVLNLQTALSAALATPWPASLGAYAQVLSLGASIITTAKGAAQGKAHNGIDEVPGSGDQTWILKAGERVVQPEANQKLTKFLDNQDSTQSSNSEGFVVNAPLIIQGGSTDDDAKFQAMLKKHQNSVTQAVKNAQTRTT
ncbi:phage tail tape measure protein [Pantoea agglomerans]|uniref:hypothetical protein n=1 Tax=Enterobacter agglomerans TaxID=549 RepID=UPI0006DD52A4|nr:hypothetical protein [Pantoea agglomerans]KPA08529.1 hypothetical protein PAP10c_0568 [Pantoea agglomerans]